MLDALVDVCDPSPRVIDGFVDRVYLVKQALVDFHNPESGIAKTMLTGSNYLWPSHIGRLVAISTQILSFNRHKRVMHFTVDIGNIHVTPARTQM